VTEGHPDKVADAISDSILDAIIEQDKACRVACETLVTTGLAFIAGEITTDCYVDMPEVIRNTIREIGYHSSQMGFDCIHPRWVLTGRPARLLQVLITNLRISLRG